MGTTHTKVSDLTWPNDSFGRSVNVKIGLTDNSDDASFHFTQKSLILLRSILDSTQPGSRDRAFSVIGPYGSGKSSFGLFAASLLSHSNSTWLDRTLQHLERISPEISEYALSTTRASNKGYIPIIIQGQKGSINLALCQSLIDALCSIENSTPNVTAEFQEKLFTARASIQSDTSGTTEVLELFKSAIHEVKLLGFSGIIVVADEFGKFLERASDEGNVPDLVTIQYLAELSSSQTEANLILLVLLHQSFRDYASTISESERTEWNKIQGRFEQIDFSEEAQELYPLIAACLNRSSDASTDKLVGKWAEHTYKQVQDIPLFKDSSKWHDILKQVYPFHPVSLYGLPRLSSRLAQNERTLFNFLVSEDPLGFKRYLSGTNVTSNELPSMTFDTVVDYFLYGSRFASWSPDIRKSISQLESAMERLGDRPAIEEKIIKILGGIRLLRCGPALPSNANTLKACLNIQEKESEQFDEAIANLIDRKLIIFRMYSDEYHLWEGSDFDFDSSIEQARNEIRNRSNIYECIPSAIQSRPVMANTYAMKTGSSRSFQRCFKSTEDFISLVRNELNETDTLVEASTSKGFDGVVIHTMPSTTSEITKIESLCVNGLGERIIVTVPQIPSGSMKLLDDLSVLNHIANENPQIYDDPVALKELEARIDSLYGVTEDAILALIEPRKDGPVWWWNGEYQKIQDGNQSNDFLYRACKSLYPKSPEIKNELINRNSLSTPVVTATKKIASQLIEHSQSPQIKLHKTSQLQLEDTMKFSGNGPEVSIFRSVFIQTGIYKNGNLIAPEDTSSLAHSWQEIKRYLEDSKKSSLSLGKLFSILQDRPYGVKRGLIPILIWAGLIAHKDTVCLYYDGTYVRTWDIETFELFEKIPHRYTVRWIDSAQSVKTLSKAMWQTLDKYNNIKSPSHTTRLGINSLLSSLFSWYRNLPDYSKNTRTLTNESLNFRQIIISTSDPVDLLFSKIPSSLGCQPLLDDSGVLTRKLSRDRSQELINGFQKVISEISESYPVLQENMLIAMSNQLECGQADWDSIQNKLDDRFNDLREYLHNERFVGFMISATSNFDRSQTTWLERLGTYLVGHSLRDWGDDDLQKFEEEMALLAQVIRDAERRQVAKGSSANKYRLQIDYPNNSTSKDWIIESTKHSDDSLQTSDNIRAKIDVINGLISDTIDIDEKTRDKLVDILTQLLIDTL